MGNLLSRIQLDTETREVISAASVAFVLRVAGYALSFFYNLILARIVGATGAGIYYQSLALVGLATVIGQVGLGDALLRFGSVRASQQRWDNLLGLARKGLLAGGLASVVVSIALMASARFLSTNVFFEPALVTPLKICALAIIPLSLASLYASLLRSQHRIATSILVKGAFMPVTSIPILLILGPRLQAQGAVIAYVASSVFSLLLGIRLWRRETVGLGGGHSDFDSGVLFGTALPLLWAGVIDTALNTFDTILIGVWTDSTSVGIYGVARRAVNLTTFILIAFNLVISPRFAALHAQGKRQELARLTQNIITIMTLIAVGATLPFVMFARPILMLFGEEFGSSTAVLQVLALAQFVNVASGPVARLLIMTGHEKLVRNNVTVHVILNVVLNALLIPRLGIIGAALTAAGTIISKNLVHAYLVQRHLKISPWRIGHESSSLH